MAIGTALFQLIGTLTPNEKRQFRRFAKRHVIGDENGYLVLFDAILANEGADEGRFLAANAAAPFAKNFTYNAHYLYNLLLRSLQTSAYEDGPLARLRSMMDKVELLMHRQLYDLADKQLRTVIKDAEAIDEMLILLNALQVKRKLLRKLGSKTLWNDLPAINAAIASVLQRLSNEGEILACYDQIFLASQNKNYLGKSEENHALRAILAQPILQGESQGLTFNSRVVLQLIHAIGQSLLGQHALAERHYRRIVQLLEANPAQIEVNQERYAMSIVDLLNCCHSLDKYDDFESGLAAIRSLKKLPPSIALRIQWISSNLEVLYYLNTLRLQTAQDVVSGWELVLFQNREKVSDASILTYSFNITLLYFIQEDFSAALKWLNRILNHPRTQARNDIQRFSRILYLLLQIELDNLDLLEVELANIRRTLNQDDLNAFEAVALTLIGKLIRRPRAEWSQHYRKFQDELKALAASSNSYFGLSELQLWIESRLTHRPMAQVLAK